MSLLDAQGQQGEGPPAGVNNYREAIAQNRFDPETSAMGAAQRGFNGEGAGDAALARQMAQQDAKKQEELVVATSRDAELAMLMVAEEARARGIDREVALQAQEGSADRSAGAGDSMKDGAKGKNKIQDGGQGEMEQALGWERQLSSGSWRGANDLAPVVLQPAGVGLASRAHTHALACFADGRPLVSTAERGGVEGTPDWVDNTRKAVQVMAPNGLVAPARVLIDGGSFYSMAGLSLRAQLGLTAADMDSGGHKVHTATGKIETLPGGLTKNPVPIVFNKGEPSEVTLYERLAFIDSKGYDLLVGTRAAYPYGLSVDRWAERATYQADWRGKGEVVGHLPMKLHQEKQGEWTTVGRRKRGGQSPAGAAFACCLTE